MAIRVLIVNKSNNPVPKYAVDGDAGMDLRAFLDEPVIIEPFERKLIPTGLYVAFPKGYEAQVRPRSGLALKHGISVLNTPGTIDAKYRGEIGVIMINLGKEPFKVENGDRIAQIVFKKVETAIFVETDKLPESERGEEGFGHTGVK